jgi:hypothetical protein
MALQAFASNVPVFFRPSSITRLSQNSFAACGCLVASAVPFVIFAAIILHHFYVTGSFMLDAGWTAYLLTHGGLDLPYPKSLGGISYFAFHVSPIFVPIAALRALVPLSDIQFFAAFIGLCYALPAIAVFWLLRSGFGLRSYTGTAVAASIAVAFSLNGLSLAIARYPHSEILVAGSIILFSAALVRRRLIAAGIFLGIALTTREDAGLHAFGLLFLLIALNRWHGIRWHAQRAEIGFAALALAYSVAVVAFQRAAWTGVSTLSLTYLGDPPLAHLSVENILLRLQFYATYRAYIVIPTIIAGIWAARTRNPYIMIGYISFLPWGILQLLASTDIAGTLSGYYAYPFLIAGFWPLAGVLFDRNRRGAAEGNALHLGFFLAMIAASFIGLSQHYNPGHMNIGAAVVSPPSISRQIATDRALAEFVRLKPALGTVLADTSIVSLAPDSFTEAETVTRRGISPPNSVIYFEGGYEAEKARNFAIGNGLDHRYHVPGTAIRLASDRLLPMLPDVASSFALATAAK